MLFSQIIAFILVMIIFESHRPGPPAMSAPASLTACLALMVALWLGGRFWVLRFLRRLAGPRPPRDPGRSARRIMAALHGLAVAAVAFMVFALELKAHLIRLDFLAASELLSGLMAIAVYFATLVLVWEATYPLERVVFHRAVSPLGYVVGQARFVAPVVFPWLLISLVRDLIRLASPGLWSWLNTGLGDLVFLALFVVALALIFPPLVRYWWGCTPWPPGPVRDLSAWVLQRAGVKVGEILSWPILEGRMITAGILGLAPRLRYLLLTPAITEALAPRELAAVVAHEAGHARHHHVAGYLGFFLGFFLGVFALTEPLALGLDYLTYYLAGSEEGAAFLLAPGEPPWLGVGLALPMVVFLVVYLRFIMGFFMRHFERQADFFSLKIMGEAGPLVAALERVALLSGDIRNHPSWHHFSIAQRVEALEAAQADPGVITRHAAMLKKAVKVYLAGLAVLAVLGGGLALWDPGEAVHQAMNLRLLERLVKTQPDSAELRYQLGLLLFESGREREGYEHLGRALAQAPDQPEILNAMAWLLATAKDEALRAPKVALELARRAVEIKPSPHIWDTLAEAYFVNGQPAKAVAAARTALAAARASRDPAQLERLPYFSQQLQRFQEAAREARP